MRIANVVTIVVIGGLGALFLGFGKGHTRVGPLRGASLNPDIYRAQIVAIDAVLFEDGPLTEDSRATVADQLVTLGRFAAVDTTNTIAVTLGQNTRSLAELARRTKTGTLLGNSPLRKQWMRIRGSLFDDAWWFRRSSADPVAAGT
ncbi:MAG: hypothetical protein ABI613_11300 [Gemmatimonadota bacterium]